MAVNQVRVIWSGVPLQGGGLTVFNFFSTVGSPAQQVAAVAAFLNATNDRRTTNVSWATDSDVVTLNAGTGALEGITSVSVTSGVGTAAGDMVAIPAQGLVRMLTNQIVNGRLLRGRIFMPGAPESDSNGGPQPTYQADYDTAALALINDTNADWAVWSRTHGVLANVVQASTWNKWAILRSRRD